MAKVETHERTDDVRVFWSESTGLFLLTAGNTSISMEPAEVERLHARIGVAINEAMSS